MLVLVEKFDNYGMVVLVDSIYKLIEAITTIQLLIERLSSILFFFTTVSVCRVVKFYFKMCVLNIF